MVVAFIFLGAPLGLDWSPAMVNVLLGSNAAILRPAPLNGNGRTSASHSSVLSGFTRRGATVRRTAPDAKNYPGGPKGATKSARGPKDPTLKNPERDTREWSGNGKGKGTGRNGAGTVKERQGNNKRTEAE